MENENTLLYHFHPETGEFTGISTARLDPLEQLPLIPAFATTAIAPSVTENEVAVYAEEEWSILPDFRGQPFYRTDDGAAVTIEEIGPVPEGLTDQAPATAFDSWQNGQWVTDTAAENNATVLAEIKALEAQITQRRLREAVLGTDGGWLETREADITALRGQLQ